MKKKVAALVFIGLLGMSGSAFADSYEIPNVGKLTVDQQENGVLVQAEDTSGYLNIKLSFFGQ